MEVSLGIARRKGEKIYKIMSLSSSSSDSRREKRQASNPIQLKKTVGSAITKRLCVVWVGQSSGLLTREKRGMAVGWMTTNVCCRPLGSLPALFGGARRAQKKNKDKDGTVS